MPVHTDLDDPRPGMPVDEARPDLDKPSDRRYAWILFVLLGVVIVVWLVTTLAIGH